jgi:hypothetical protein
MNLILYIFCFLLAARVPVRAVVLSVLSDTQHNKYNHYVRVSSSCRTCGRSKGVYFRVFVEFLYAIERKTGACCQYIRLNAYLFLMQVEFTICELTLWYERAINTSAVCTAVG